MKRIILLTALILLLISPYSICYSQELTHDLEVKIKEEVGEQFNIFLASLSQLNHDIWTESFSKENFISVFESWFVGGFTDYDKWISYVRKSFSMRERQEFNSLDVSISPLSPELALLTHVGIYENWHKNGEYHKHACNVAILWKRENDLWKIIYMSEDWIPAEELNSIKCVI